MKSLFVHTLSSALLFGLSGFQSTAAMAHPVKPIRLVVTFPACGAPDILARLFGEKAQLGQAVIIDNKPGAGGNIGADIVSTPRRGLHPGHGHGRHALHQRGALRQDVLRHGEELLPRKVASLCNVHSPLSAKKSRHLMTMAPFHQALKPKNTVIRCNSSSRATPKAFSRVADTTKPTSGISTSSLTLRLA